MGKSHPAGGCDYCDSVFLLLAYADFGQLHGIDHEGWGNRADEPLCDDAGKYETGDIVMFHYYDADGGKTVVKRIIATEGDHIRILADGGVEVNGARLQEEYVHGRTDGLVDMTVPKGTVFVMGDNRGESFDSRNMGAIPCEDLKGKVFFRLFPLGRIR